jgi:DNA recombination protein RmuC
MNALLPWLVALVACLAVIVLWWSSAASARRQRAEVEALRAELRRLEEKNDALRDASARLPDIGERAARAEAEAEARLLRLNEVSSARVALEERAKALQATLETLEARLAAERTGAAELHAGIDRLRNQLSAAEAELRATIAALSETRRQNDGLKAAGEALNASLLDALQRATQAEADRDAARALQERTHQFLVEAQGTLRIAFTEAASKVFDEKAISLEQRITASADASKVGLETTLKPLAEHIAQFQQRLETITGENAKARSELSGKIDALVHLNRDMAAAADSLTKALKGNAKARGDWGEMVLDTVLAASGLVEGSHYFRQANGRDEDTGDRLRPDVVVALPDARKVIIDSKVSLVAWAEAVDTDDQEIVGAALQRHVASLRTHVRQLSDKNYPALYPGEALEITIAFVPIEAALSKALELSPQLQREAFQKGIAFATPNTLMAMMQVVERLWVRDRLQQQVATIGEEAAKLLDSVSAFLTEFGEVEQSFGKTSAQLKQIRTRMESSPQSVLARARRLVDAGARGKRKLHASLAAGAASTDALSLQPAPEAGSPPENVTGDDTISADAE